jgi:dihydrofolate synthase/folylpolyglutamate synthase
VSGSVHSAPLLAELRRSAPAAIDLTLDRVHRLLEVLGHPEQRLPPAVHIAGTNGKGSVLALLRAMLEADHSRVHAYVSPPLRAATEAIRLAYAPGKSQDISDAEFARLLGRVLGASTKAPVTSFEGETAAAFLAFAEKPADVVLLEAGMGGRCDATNVVDRPLLTVLTPIGLDHQAYLGPTVADIAHAKAGILKSGVTCIVARQQPAAHEVIEAEAKRVGAPLVHCGRDYDAYAQNGRLIYQDEDRLLDLPLPALFGRHQVDNAGTALAAALRLGRLRPAQESLAAGLVRVHWPGRFQPLPAVLRKSGLPAGSEVWVDGGHNRDAAIAIVEALRSRNRERPLPLHLIVGMLASRDPTPYLEPLLALATSLTAVPVSDTSRAYAGSHRTGTIVAAARALGATAGEAPGFEAALALLRAAEEPIRVLIAGSLHLAGAVLEAEERSA